MKEFLWSAITIGNQIKESTFHLFAGHEFLYAIIFIVLGCIFLASGLDDLLIDIIYFLKARKSVINFDNIKNKVLAKKESNIAMVIPAWQESSVISPMLLSNMANIKYKNYKIFVGVYPNDPDTINIVRALAKKYEMIKMVLCKRPGPTTKADCLNQVYKAIGEEEEKSNLKFSMILMHDAEDVIHPFALKIYNYYIEQYDFIQIPIFSLPLKQNEWIAGTYIDEFASCHAKTMLVRSHLGASIPSAGVGTGLSRRALEKYDEKYGHVFNEKNLTEDYELGIKFFQNFQRSAFLLIKMNGTLSGGKKIFKQHFMATQEYFPKKLRASIRQKARWIRGIALQSSKELGWNGGLIEKWMLFRDRKGVLTNIINFIGLVFLIPFFLNLTQLSIQLSPRMRLFSEILIWLNTTLLINYIFQRFYFVAKIYGIAQGLLSIPRLLVGIYINAMATFRALYLPWAEKFKKKGIIWEKTDHQFPTDLLIMEDINATRLNSSKKKKVI